MKKILAIDDQPDNLVTIKAVIHSFLPGYEVLTALSGAAGISLAQESQPETILLDIIMPQMDGYETCRLLKSSEQTKHIPVILITAIKTDPESRIKGLETGADAFLSKPIDPAELSAQIKVILRLKEAENKLRSEKTEIEQIVRQRTKELNETVEKLRISEERFKNIAESAGEWIWEVDANGCYTFVSSVCEEILGYKPEEIIGKKYFYDFFEPGIKEATKEKALKVFSQRLPFSNFENPNQHRDGHIVILETTGSPMFDENGQFTGYRGVDKDNTARKIAEKKLAQERILLRTLIDNIPDAIFIKDVSLRKILANPADLANIGKTGEEVLGKTDNEVFPANIAEKLMADDHFVIKNGQPIINREELLVNSQGESRWLLTSKLPLFDENGKVTGLVGIGRDFTDRKLNEEKLRQSEEKYSTYFRHAPIGYQSLNKDGFIIEVNEKWLDILKYSREEVSGKWFGDFLENGQKEKFRQLFSKNILEGNVIKDFEFCLNRKDGEIVVAEFSANAGYDGEGNFKRIHCVFQDITERKKAEEKLRDALRKAEESDRLKSTFLSTMSHELRTPLNAVIGFSEMITKDLPVEEMVSFGQIINHSGNHLLSIIEDLFDISLIESGEIKVFKSEIRLAQLLHEVYEVMAAEQTRLEKQHIDLKMLLPDELKNQVFYSDPDKIRQILINLLKNALKFTTDGFIHFGCTIEDSNNARPLRFFVKDSGIGIPEEKQALIFDAFRQADDSYTRKYGGVGLGLSISKKLTELLGGAITLISKEGIGSDFYIELPLSEQLHENKSEIKKVYGTISEIKILIAEDDEASCLLLKYILAGENAQLLWAKNGREAIEICENDSSIGLVLMDINMPVLNGLDAAREIKKFRPSLPIIAQTAYAVAGDKERILDSGCNDYISKPLEKNMLLELIGKFGVKPIK